MESKEGGGWNRYRELAEEKSEKLTKVIEDKNKSIEMIMKEFERITSDIKFEAFGKVTLKDKKKVKVKECSKFNDEDVAKDLLKKQTEKAEEELKKLKESKKGRTANVFEIVKSIQGPKKGGTMEAYAITDPATGIVAVAGKEIKRISLEYCRGVLTNNEVEEDCRNEIRLKENMHTERMLVSEKGEFNPSREIFNRVVKKFKKNDKRNYDFLLKTGEKFKEVVYKFCKRMLDEEVFPSSFDNTTLHQIYKGKGKREVLSNNSTYIARIGYQEQQKGWWWK